MINAAFTIAPEVVYSPMVPVELLTTKRLFPDTATALGKFKPLISEEFIIAPDVLYSPIVPVSSFATNRFPPDKAIPVGNPSPETNEPLITEPEVVYSPIVLSLAWLTKIWPRAKAGMPQIITRRVTEKTINRGLIDLDASRGGIMLSD